MNGNICGTHQVHNVDELKTKVWHDLGQIVSGAAGQISGEISETLFTFSKTAYSNSYVCDAFFYWQYK